jgi:hypothetical protein
MGEEDEDESEDSERWLSVHCEGSRAAIEGRGAFRRFKDILSQWPDESGR